MSPIIRNHSVKIIHILSGDVWAGAEVQAFRTISYLNESINFKVMCVLFNDGVLYDKLRACNIKTVICDESELGNVMIMSRLSKIIREFQPDIIHIHKIKEHFMAELVSLLVLRRIRLVRTIHGESRTPRNLPFLKKLRSNLVVSLDNLLIRKAADVAIAVSKDLQKRIAGNNTGGDIRQIYNALDTKALDALGDKKAIRKHYGVTHQFWIGTAARLVDVKNLPLLIEAGKFLAEKKLPIKISIFGDGPLRASLLELIDRYELAGTVVLSGFEPDILPVIHSLDVFVLTSHHEGIPMSLLEAMALRVPVISTNVGGIAEVIETGLNGLLVPANDAKALSEAIIRLYENRELCVQYAFNARKTIENKFSYPDAADRLCDIYLSLVRS